jgi:hypothetical protein
MPSKNRTQNINPDMRTPAQKAAETRRANKAAEEQRNQELLESSEFDSTSFNLTSTPDSNSTSSKNASPGKTECSPR